VALLGLPAAAHAQGELPVGEAEGVRIVRERGAIVVVFTPHAKKLWRRVAGRRVSVLCTEFLGDGTAGGGATMRAPKRGRKIRTGDLTRGLDYCEVSLEPRRRGRSSKLVVSVPLTQRGALFLDEREVARGLFGLLVAIDFAFEERGPGAYPTAEQVLTRFPQFRGHVIPLPGPADTPPPRTIGYWSDGAAHVAVVALATAGRRLFIEYDGDVLHTNVSGYIFSE
jgi:hypothetical protein